MTSDGTHEETVNFWEKNNYFGIKNILFFPQGMVFDLFDFLFIILF